MARDFLLMCNKVSVLPAKGGRLQPLQQEAEAKVVHNDRSFLVTAEGRAPVRGTGPGQVDIVLVHSFSNFDEAIERSHRKGGPAATMVYMCLSGPTNTDSAREIEKRCQALALAKDKGVVKDRLQAVKDGTFFLDLSMPEFFALRIRTHYPWARDKKYWRLGIGGAKKQKAAARKRERGIEKKAAAAKKKAA